MQKHRKRLQRCVNQLNVVFNTDDFELAYAVPLEVALFSELEQQARQRGVKVETLVNVWLRQKLTEHMAV